jgi:hypothetical protein
LLDQKEKKSRQNDATAHRPLPLARHFVYPALLLVIWFVMLIWTYRDKRLNACYSVAHGKILSQAQDDNNDQMEKWEGARA